MILLSDSRRPLVSCPVCRTGCKGRPLRDGRPKLMECDCKRLARGFADDGPVWTFRTHGPTSDGADGEAMLMLRSGRLMVAYDYGGDLEWAQVSFDDAEDLVGEVVRLAAEDQ